MTYAWENYGAAKVGAANSWVRVKIDSGNERANGVPLAGNKIRWLSNWLSSELRHFFKINVLHPSAARERDLRAAREVFRERERL